MRFTLTRVITVGLVLAAAFGVLLLIVYPTTIGKISVGLLAPIVAWLALPGGKGRQGVCHSCGASPKKQKLENVQTKVEATSRAEATGGNVTVHHGWEVTVERKIFCRNCGAYNNVVKSRFVNNKEAATAAEALIFVAKHDADGTGYLNTLGEPK